MRIIIAGAGEVGTHLAKLLSREDHDIVLIDADEEKLQTLDANYNLLTVVGSPTSINILTEAGARKADLFIAVTPYETRNVTSCMLAANLGAVKTVARIDNNEYLQPENRLIFSKMGVDELIYPELLAAQEIVTALRRNWVRHWFELCDGELILIGVKLRESALVINHKLFDLTSTNKHLYHIAAIKRKHETIIPRGNDELKVGDIVYFITTRDHVQDIRLLAGKEEVNVKKVIVMGGSRIAIRTADLVPDSVKLKVIEIDRQKSYKLVEKMNNATIIHGNARETELLKEEGIADCDAFISLTDSSETNILSCLTAQGFGVPKTIAEVENNSFISTAEELNIGTIVNKKLLAASRIYQLLLEEDHSNTKCLSLADAEVVEFVAKSGSKITQAKVKDLKLPKEMTLGGLIRDGKGQIVTGQTQIQPNDHVLVMCLDTPLSKIEKLFT